MMLIREKGADGNTPAGKSGGRTALFAAEGGGHTALSQKIRETVNLPFWLGWFI
jgi:hypothetical protein